MNNEGNKDREVDDYDYCIVLHPDDEYRQTVEALSNIVDFQELSLNSGNIPNNTSSSGRRTSESNFKLISKEEYEQRLSSLDSEREKARREARRSSAGFQEKYVVSDDVAMSNFISLLGQGVYLTRHRANNESELIQLKSSAFSVNSCEYLEWKTHRGPIESAQRESNSPPPYESIQQYNTTIQDDCTLSYDYILSLFSSGFGNKGRFHESHILRVHPARHEDPTSPGSYGTNTLRRSLDSFNVDLTFSLILKTPHRSEQFYILDFECESFDVYLLLLKGFMLLYERSRKSRLEEEKEKGYVEASLLYRYQLPNDFHIWKSETPALDPVKQLFSPQKLDFLTLSLSPNRLLSNSEYETQSATTHFKSRAPPSMDSNEIPPAQFLGWSSAGTQVWARLKMAGCEVKCQFSWDLTQVLMMIRLPQWRLEEVAEKMGLHTKNRNGNLRRFKISNRMKFQQDETGSGPLFRSSERQQIVEFLICSLIKDGGAELDQDTGLGKYIVQRFPLHKYDRLNRISHNWVTYWKREPFGHSSPAWSPFSVPISYTLKQTYLSIKHVLTNALKQPYEDITEYFGETVAFYFAFLSFYTRWLALPAFLGFIVFMVQIEQNKMDNVLCIPYAFFIMIWAAYFLVAWRREEARLAFEWNVLNYEVEEMQRPQFMGAVVHDEVTGEERKEYAFGKRLLRYCVTVPIICSVTALMIYIMYSMAINQDQMYQSYIHERDNRNSNTSSNSLNFSFSSKDFQKERFWEVAMFYPLLYSILVDIVASMFNKLAESLNKFENHRTQTAYTNRYILKVFAFRMVIVFTSLFYYAFVASSSDNPFFRISVIMFSLLTLGQWFGIVLHVYVPFCYQRVLLFYTKYKVLEIRRQVYLARGYVENKMEADACKVDARGEVRNACSISNSSSRNFRSTLDGSQLGNTLEEGRLRQSMAAIDKRERLLEVATSTSWQQAMMLPYTCMSDWTIIIVQLGLILLFAPVFPLAPLIAMINNVFLIRFNAYKLCHSRQRPISQKTGSIGVWEDVLQLMSVSGILSNFAVMGLTSDVFRKGLGGLTDLAFALILFLFEHLMLLFKYFLHSTMPKIPTIVLRAQARRNRTSKEDGAAPLGRPKKPAKPFRNRFVWSNKTIQQSTGNGDGGGNVDEPAIPSAQEVQAYDKLHSNNSSFGVSPGCALGDDGESMNKTTARFPAETKESEEERWKNARSHNSPLLHHMSPVLEEEIEESQTQEYLRKGIGCIASTESDTNDSVLYSYSSCQENSKSLAASAPDLPPSAVDTKTNSTPQRLSKVSIRHSSPRRYPSPIPIRTASHFHDTSFDESTESGSELDRSLPFAEASPLGSGDGINNVKVNLHFHVNDSVEVDESSYGAGTVAARRRYLESRSGRSWQRNTNDSIRHSSRNTIHNSQPGASPATRSMPSSRIKALVDSTQNQVRAEADLSSQELELTPVVVVSGNTEHSGRNMSKYFQNNSERSANENAASPYSSIVAARKAVFSSPGGLNNTSQPQTPHQRSKLKSTQQKSHQASSSFREARSWIINSISENNSAAANTATTKSTPAASATARTGKSPRQVTN